jgi:hypothetical protein
MRSATFRFCVVNALKGLSSTWIVQEADDSVVVGTKTADGHLKAILSPTMRTSLGITLPPSLHRDTPQTQNLVLDQERENAAHRPFDLAMSVMFLGERSVQIRRAPSGRNGRRIVQVESAGKDEAVEMSIGFSSLPPAALTDILPDFGTCLSVRNVSDGRFLYICQAIRAFPHMHLDSTQDIGRPSISPTGLPGLYRTDPGIPGVIRILQTAPGQIHGL